MGHVIAGLYEEFRAVGLVLLGGSLGAERRGGTLGMRQLESAVHFVGGYVVEELAVVALGQRVPVLLGSLQQRERAHHIGAGKGEGILDGAVDMALGGEMDDAVDAVLADDAAHLVEVGDVGLHEGIVGLVLDVLEVGEVAGVCEFVEIDYAVVGIFVDEQAHDVRAYEAGAAGD